MRVNAATSTLYILCLRRGDITLSLLMLITINRFCQDIPISLAGVIPSTSAKMKSGAG